MEWRPIDRSSVDGNVEHGGEGEYSEIMYSRSSDLPDKVRASEVSQEQQLYTDCARMTNNDAEGRVARSFRRSSSWDEDIWKQNLSRGILNIANLNLREVPSRALSYDKPITAVYLHDNRLQSLPRGFFENLPLLSWCDLRNNKLTAIPELGSRHDSLKVLILKGNNLKSLPYSLALARGLEALSVDGNPLMDPPEEVVNQGSMAMIEYLETKHVARASPFDQVQSASDDTSDSESFVLSSDAIADEEHRKKYAAKDIPLFGVYCNFEQQNKDTASERRRRAELNDVYTKGMWRHKPYNAPSIVGLFAKSAQEARDKVVKQNQESIIQKLRDRIVLQKWRSEARSSQEKCKSSFSVGTANGPSASSSIKHSSPLFDGNNNSSDILKDEFKNQLLKTIQSVRDLAINPNENITTTKARENMHKMIELREQLFNMTIAGKPKK